MSELFLFFFATRRAKQQFSETSAMVTNLSTPDDTYLKPKYLQNYKKQGDDIFRSISQHFARLHATYTPQEW